MGQVAFRFWNVYFGFRKVKSLNNKLAGIVDVITPTNTLARQLEKYVTNVENLIISQMYVEPARKTNT